ncbi:MAG: YccJ family protein [Flavobacteriaceae bacterium]|nr:YccJ family protein [Flavobacteriaceae bacterium]
MKAQIKLSTYRRVIMRISRMSANDKIAWADSHETSLELVLAIFAICDDIDQAEKIWDDPTVAQMKTIVKEAWANSIEDVLVWGETKFIRNLVEDEVQAGVSDRQLEISEIVKKIDDSLNESGSEVPEEYKQAYLAGYYRQILKNVKQMLRNLEA